MAAVIDHKRLNEENTINLLSFRKNLLSILDKKGTTEEFKKFLQDKDGLFLTIALVEAAKRDKLQEVDYLLNTRKVPIDNRDNTGYTAFNAAFSHPASRASRKMVELLLQHGATCFSQESDSIVYAKADPELMREHASEWQTPPKPEKKETQKQVVKNKPIHGMDDVMLDVVRTAKMYNLNEDVINALFTQLRQESRVEDEYVPPIVPRYSMTQANSILNEFPALEGLDHFSLAREPAPAGDKRKGEKPS